MKYVITSYYPKGYMIEDDWVAYSEIDENGFDWGERVHHVSIAIDEVEHAVWDELKNKYAIVNHDKRLRIAKLFGTMFMLGFEVGL